ncbi:Protein of unknown function [Alkalimonas amylolytica]|uniref:Uncharacterized protein n=2 Tax=Alkalimonas amylolytica TaxID=152573 RepID=A0A1H3XTT9_ALKAM|nr:Protein of unknown function [Alkalimonas amylolytica]
MDGKPLVEKAFLESQKKPYCDFDFLLFFVDIDFDYIHQKQLNLHNSFIYNAYCSEEKKLHYNDLECYLLNTSALAKVLANFDIEPYEVDTIRDKLKTGSRAIGSLRAADYIAQRKFGLSKSILNGLEIDDYFDPSNIFINLKEIKQDLPRWSNYKEHVEDLVSIAEKLDRETPNDWSLSRGHDVTKMLSMHLETRSRRKVTTESIEMMLRLACEKFEFENSPMGKRFIKTACVAA